VTLGISNRAKGVQDIARWTDEQAVPTVAVVTPRAATGPDELVLSGTVEPSTPARSSRAPADT
jgi:hypothetical protein